MELSYRLGELPSSTYSGRLCPLTALSNAQRGNGMGGKGS